MEAIIADFTRRGDLVVDPFAGSGSTLVACRRHGRRSIGWEINPAYAAIADRRIAETTEQASLFERAVKHEQLGLLGK